MKTRLSVLLPCSHCECTEEHPGEEKKGDPLLSYVKKRIRLSLHTVYNRVTRSVGGMIFFTRNLYCANNTGIVCKIDLVKAAWLLCAERP